MRHCRQCRADAIGLIGSDLSQIPELLHIQGSYTAEQRMVIRNELAAGMKQTASAQARIGEDWNGAVRVAVATRGSNVINQHFGHAKEFIIYDVLQGNLRFVGVRKGDINEQLLESTRYLHYFQ